MIDQEATIRLFFYGTLMRGQCHHGLVAPWLTHAEPARVWGRLYQLEAGYPALEVPPESVLATGTDAPRLDAATGQWETSQPLKMHAGDWGWVHGDVAELRDPAQSIPPIDDYEEVRSGDTCLYLRVLIPVACDRDTLPAWTYVRTIGSGGTRIASGVWTP